MTQTSIPDRVHIRLIDPEGHDHALSGRAGQSIMEIAVAAGTAGIEAQCGGACSCATCHIYVGAEWLSMLPMPSDLESEMLDFSRAERRATSRLSCQIMLEPALEGFYAEIADN